MARFDLRELLSTNTYPGRGIITGVSADGRDSVVAYFIMGRSVNSRNRIFTKTADGIRTQAFDEAKLTDPSLIIYHPVRVYNGNVIVTNGDQTDTVWEAVKQGEGFEQALRTRTFEPDAPNFTPRISGFVKPDGAYTLSILKSADGNDASVQRFFYEYAQPVAGEGHFIHTYQCDGEPIPSFYGEPENIAVDGDIDTFTNLIWESLNADNKVSLYVRFTPIGAGEARERIVNKNQ